MRTPSKKVLAVLAVSAATLALLLPAGSASADAGPTSTDIVGVGSDTLQYMLDFGADGDALGDSGFNPHQVSRLVSLDATPDANARAGYLNGSANGALLALNPTVVLRGGEAPILRPNGSGAGLSALEADAANDNINFVRASSATSATDVANFGTVASSTKVGPIEEVRIAHESVAIAEGTTTNAPALTRSQLFTIYECNGHTGNTPTEWSDVGGASNDVIIPIVPQPGSGTRKTFLTDIGFSVASDGTATPALGSCVHVDEENNPYALYLTSAGLPQADPYLLSAAPNPDAIEPFSQARYNLYHNNGGYFTNPNLAYGATSTTDQVILNPAIQLQLTGTPSGGHLTSTAEPSTAVYTDKRGLYVDFRVSDISSTAHFNGSSVNWVHQLFIGPSAFFGPSGLGVSLLSAAGAIPDYSDCGANQVDTSGCAALLTP